MRVSPACLGKLFALIACTLATSSAVYAQEPNETTVTAVTVRGTEVHEYDLAKMRARGRIVYVSSGPKTFSDRMIDNDLQTSFRFSESDSSPTVVVELAKSAPLHRISTTFKAEDAQLDVMMLNELPKDLADLQFAKPDVSRVSLPDEHGMVAADFAVSSARYVVFRWKRKKSRDPFTVAEISAFSTNGADWISDADVHLADNAKSITLLGPPQVGVVSY